MVEVDRGPWPAAYPVDFEIPKPEFKSFGKIPRLHREAVISEKLDGTNAQVYINDSGNVYAGSRNRWITPEDDNYGFARWVEGNKSELLKLGPGTHYGEWWGQGIQRNYGLKEKRFSLFNAGRWGDPYVRPQCCDVVPVLYQGVFHSSEVEKAISALIMFGSIAAPGFMNPEGIIVYHTMSRQLYKVTCKDDDKAKGEV